MKELVDEVVRLSQEFGILTEYTAFLAREGNDLTDVRGNAYRANARFDNRAIRQRDGWGSVTQEMNGRFMRDQDWVNQRNMNFTPAYTRPFIDTALMPEAAQSQQANANNLERVQISNVQQLNDRAYFNNTGRWVESKVALRAAKEKAALEPTKVVEFGSEEFMKLAEQLAKEGRQGSISLRGEILLEVGKEVVLVKNPLAPTDAAVAQAQSDESIGPRGHFSSSEDWKAPAENAQRRVESKAAKRLIEAEK